MGLSGKNTVNDDFVVDASHPHADVGRAQAVAVRPCVHATELARDDGGKGGSPASR